MMFTLAQQTNTFCKSNTKSTSSQFMHWTEISYVKTTTPHFQSHMGHLNVPSSISTYHSDINVSDPKTKKANRMQEIKIQWYPKSG